MVGICENRVVIVTGAGRGIGRAHAEEFARQGARVVVNDIGADVDGSGTATAPADEVVRSIQVAGGEAVASSEDVSNWEGSQSLVQTAIDTFGGLDVVVNNAGILRDRMLINMTQEDWDSVMRVHLGGTFGVTHHAARYWRQRHHEGQSVDARVINTSSGAGLFGNVGQANYSSAKAGIAAFTLVVAEELRRYGVTVNAIAPGARTRMTGELFASHMAAPDSGFDAMSPDNIAPLVVWLGSPESHGTTGRMFNVGGDEISVAIGWTRGPAATNEGAHWEYSHMGRAIGKLLEDAPDPMPVIGTKESGFGPQN